MIKFERVTGFEDVKLPKRATKGSAGYDFYLNEDLTLYPGETAVIQTGIKALMPEDVVLMIYPRSGLGFKYRLQLDNTVGVIDSDYYYSDNEGHIMIKVTHDGKNGSRPMELKKGDRFAQGIFMNYLITDDDDTDGIRNGGIGSTGRV